MTEQNLHQKLQNASHQIISAQETVIQAQGKDAQLIEQAQQQLREAEHVLESLQNEAGTEATHNAQFQQAFEALHNVREQINEYQDNSNEING
jgi:glycyl-tRNA synthetase beta subunit